ncbi:MAG TPA: UvrD-helicase domain-containing protein [Candidatus Polarisedimenticolaceae bacterium]|nr:UvrD-helicase domain-containing protein [Candidatus Polarisedimenticolaceae bacterium]
MTALNPEQRSAVEHADGPLLILAGAGSGKTRVLTHRIARLVDRGFDPGSIVAVSFTNKAADEMRRRTASLVGSRRASLLTMSTFHSFGLTLLREELRESGDRARFVVFDQADSLGLVREILRGIYRGGAARRFDPLAILTRISNWKSASVRPADAAADSACEYDAVAREIYPEYDERLQAMRAYDFDDLVCLPVRLLRDDPALRERWRGRIAHLLVDEFQDTSRVQLELVKLLANAQRNVCVVGDDDQSIYGWRGADVGNILQFATHFPGARVIKLETNYRSRAPILDVANAVIAGGAHRHSKTLLAARGAGDAVRICLCDDGQAEASFVAGEIRDLTSAGSYRLDQIAVLYRSNLQARPVEQALTEAGIPYRLFGGQQFLDRKEVKDVAAYLRVVVNRSDEISLRRILNYPARGVGGRSVRRLERHAREHGIPFVDAFDRADAIVDLPDGARHGLASLRALLGEARRRLERTGRLSAVAHRLIEEIDLRAALDDRAEGGNQGEARFHNATALVGWIERYERETPRDRKSLAEFLQRVALGGARADQDEDRPGVTLSTLHAAKGLEFPVVLLISCVEGRLPHSRSTDPTKSAAVAADPDEERRLFYVGITRARDRLYLLATRQRTLRGKTVDVAPSRYLDGIPPDRLERYERPEQRELSGSELSAAVRELLDRHRGPGGRAAEPGRDGYCR